MFNENSGLVQLWVMNINAGNYAREQVPNLSNLRETVYGILDNREKVQEMLDGDKS